ncbi:MAG: biotin/lipoate A/B protein ligase family protein [Halobacteriaceae archaeon]
MAISELEWRFIPEESRAGAMNMALDEIAAETVTTENLCTVRIYTWDPSTFSLGYNQDNKTIDWEFCRNNDIPIVRRPTGGGGIFHDTYGDISYSIIGPAEHFPGDLMDCYHLLCRPIIAAFHNMGIQVDYVASQAPSLFSPACYLRELHPAHDLVANGKKISGNAQYRQRSAVIQHGSISYSLDPETHLGVFNNHSVTEQEFTNRVTAIDEEIDISREKAIAYLEDSLRSFTDATEGEWTDEELTAAQNRAEEKYQSQT